jgi:uncharacterized protein YqcC (DUF446 family)
MIGMDMSYELAGEFADAIEQELRRMNVWQSEPLRDEAYRFSRPFAGDTMSFYQWLQFILVPRIRSVIKDRGKFPPSSHVGAYAVRELDGEHEASDLIALLIRFDRFIETGSHSEGV